MDTVLTFPSVTVSKTTAGLALIGLYALISTPERIDPDDLPAVQIAVIELSSKVKEAEEGATIVSVCDAPLCEICGYPTEDNVPRCSWHEDH